MLSGAFGKVWRVYLLEPQEKTEVVLGLDAVAGAAESASLGEESRANELKQTPADASPIAGLRRSALRLADVHMLPRSTKIEVVMAAGRAVVGKSESNQP